MGRLGRVKQTLTLRETEFLYTYGIPKCRPIRPGSEKQTMPHLLHISGQQIHPFKKVVNLKMSLENLRKLLPVVFDEIKPATKPKNGPNQPPRARASDFETIPQPKGENCLDQMVRETPAIKKILRVSKRLADLCSGEDLEADAQIIRDATSATLRIYDLPKKTWIVIPDHKTRLAAVTLRRAYAEGLPVKREIVMSSTFVSAEEILERMRQSPEALRRFPEIAEPKTIEMDVQETG